MKKKLIFFDGTLEQGGAERVISILSSRLAENGYNVEILLYHDSEIFYELNHKVKVKFVKRETKSNSIFRNLRWMHDYFNKNADVIVSFLAPFNILALLAHMGVKAPIIVADRNDPRCIPSNFIVRRVRDFLYRFADGIVVQTQQNFDYFSEAVKRKSTIIYNPIDLNEKKGLAYRSDKRKEIVSVGRLMPQKNQKMLLEAFGKVYQIHTDYTLTIYGDGPLRKELENKVTELGLDGVVNLPGSVKDLFNKIATSEVFVLPSNYEGMSNALIEAMCLGLPCISTKVSGATDLVESGVNGELIDIGDTEMLTVKLSDLLNSEDLRNKYAKNAILLNERLDIDVIMNQWIGYIAEILSDRTNYN